MVFNLVFDWRVNQARKNEPGFSMGVIVKKAQGYRDGKPGPMNRHGSSAAALERILNLL